MRKAKVTYNAPRGDSKVVEMGGVTFFDGQTVEINNADNAHLFGKLQTNPLFDVDVGEDEPTPSKRKPGRLSNAEKTLDAEAAEKARLQAEADAKDAAEKEAAEKAKAEGGDKLPTVQPIT